jgi:hypothetical protein
MVWRISQHSGNQSSQKQSHFTKFHHHHLPSRYRPFTACSELMDLFGHLEGLLGRGISPTQGLYLYTGQHNTTQKNAETHPCGSSGIRSHDPSVRAVEDSTCLRPHGYWDRLHEIPYVLNIHISETVYNTNDLQWIQKYHKRSYNHTLVSSLGYVTEFQDPCYQGEFPGTDLC